MKIEVAELLSRLTGSPMYIKTVCLFGKRLFGRFIRA
jgi:hypothetical protein